MKPELKLLVGGIEVRRKRKWRIGMPRNRYRIVRHNGKAHGFNTECWRWWFPFWRRINSSTFMWTTIEGAEMCAREHAHGGVQRVKID